MRQDDWTKKIGLQRSDSRASSGWVPFLMHIWIPTEVAKSRTLAMRRQSTTYVTLALTGPIMSSFFTLSIVQRFCTTVTAKMDAVKIWWLRFLIGCLTSGYGFAAMQGSLQLHFFMSTRKHLMLHHTSVQLKS